MTPAESTAPYSSFEKLTVFVSYARVDRQIADALVVALELRDIEVKIDRRNLRYGEDWQAELAEFILRSDTVVWLLSPASIASGICGWELGEVVRLSKRLVPVRVAAVNDATIPAHLGKIHILPAEGTFSIDRDMTSLLTALSADRPWVKKHTHLAERAKAWVDAGRPENDRLLSGLELREAQAWIEAVPLARPGLAAPPQPTELHRAFLTASRAAEEAATRERTMREQAARVAKGYQFSSRAQLAIEGKCFDRGLRLALAGISLSQPDTPEALFEDVVDAARGSRLKLEARPESGIAAATVTPDLRLAAVVAGNGALAVWDVNSARIIATTDGRGQPTGGIINAAIDADGKRILIARSSDHADVVDAQTGKVLRRLGPHVGKNVRVGFVDGTSFGFSTDEPLASIIGKKQYFALNMWNIETGERLYTIDDFSGAVDTVLIHPDRSVFVTNHWSDECLAWNVVSGERVRSLSAHSIPAVRCFSPDGRRYLVVGNDLMVVSVHEWGSDARLFQFTGHSQPVRCACWSPDGTRVATGDGEGVVGLWDAVTGERYGWLVDSTADEITALSFTEDGEGLIVATSTAAAMALWDVKNRRLAAVIHGHQSPITNIEVSVDGRSFCSVAAGEAVRVWTLEDYPQSSPPTVSLPHPSQAGLRVERVKAPKFDGPDLSFLDRAPGVRIFGPLEGRAALGPVLARGLGDAEAFTDAERKADSQVREAPLNPFQALRDLPLRGA
jgi:WD40 repeat protein